MAVLVLRVKPKSKRVRPTPSILKAAPVMRIVSGALGVLVPVRPFLPKEALIRSLARQAKQVSKPIHGIPQVVLMN